MTDTTPLDLRCLIVHATQWEGFQQMLATRRMQADPMPLIGGTAPRFVLRPTPPDPGHKNSYHLTERQLSVLTELAKGAGNKEIGEALFLAENTVKTHMMKMMAKLGARDRAHAVGIAYRAGILPTWPTS